MQKEKTASWRWRLSLTYIEGKLYEFDYQTF